MRRTLLKIYRWLGWYLFDRHMPHRPTKPTRMEATVEMNIGTAHVTKMFSFYSPLEGKYKASEAIGNLLFGDIKRKDLK